MDTKIKKLAAGIALAGALTVGTAGAAVAADTSASSTTAPSAQASTGHPLIRAHFRRGAMKVVADTLGVSRADLRTAVAGGQTIGQYATSLGKDPAAVVDALTKAGNAKVDQLVAEGRLQQDRADSIKSKLSTRIDTLMKHQFRSHTSA
jgi:hypothetical protein